MNPRTWMWNTIGLVLTLAGCLVAFNVWVDIYGIYRDPHGRHLPAYGDPRIAKYLLSSRYVPENFNAVLLGSSVSANWDLSGLDGLRVYNESLNGGNIAEEKTLIEEALSRPGIRAAFLIVHPYITHAHEFNTVRLTPREKFAALGSVSLWNAYLENIKIYLHRASLAINDAGVEDFGTLRRQLNPDLTRLMRPGEDFEVDATALALYRDLVDELHARKVKVIFIVPAVSEDILDGKRAAFAKYLQLIRSMAPQDRWIDFTTEPYAGFRRNRNNFGDGVHLQPAAAAELVQAINEQLKSWGLS